MNETLGERVMGWMFANVVPWLIVFGIVFLCLAMVFMVLDAILGDSK